MKKIIFFFLSMTVVSYCHSKETHRYITKEDSTKQTKTLKKENLLFLEIAGNGGLLSINY